MYGIRIFQYPEIKNGIGYACPGNRGLFENARTGMAPANSSPQAMPSPKPATGLLIACHAVAHLRRFVRLSSLALTAGFRLELA